MLAFDDVSFTFVNGPTVLSHVTLDVPAGALVGILGPNGSGKTTMLRLASGALRPSSGRVRLGDSDLGSYGRRELARRLAVVPQETTLAFDYSVLEVVLMGRYPHLGAFAVEGPADLAAAGRAMRATGTEHLAPRPFPTLSGGEKQRAIIASALAQLDNAEAPGAGAILLLDEPTASLDVRYQLEVLTVLRRLHDERGVTIALTTHDLRLARAICTSVVLLARGRILDAGPPEATLRSERLAELFEVDATLAQPFFG